MQDWDQLGTALAGRARHIAALRREKLERAAARESYRCWAHATVTQVIDALHTLLSQRAAELGLGTTHGVEVLPPRDVCLDGSGRCTRVMSLRLGPDVVDLYAQWTPGSPPTLHLLLSRTRRGRPLRMLCVPGGWLSAQDNKTAYRLLEFEQDQPVALEQIALRAARLLAVG